MHPVQYNRMELGDRLLGARRRHALGSRPEQAVRQDRPPGLVHQGQAQPFNHHHRIECERAVRVSRSKLHHSSPQGA